MCEIVKNISYDADLRQKAVSTLCARYPIIHATTIGKSCAGRDITALRIGKGAEYALFTAAFHGSEHLTQNILLYFAEELAEAMTTDGTVTDMNVRRALFGRGVILIPCVNPDGCEISIHGAPGCGKAADIIARLCHNDFAHWNANIRGVDLNHNFNAGWNELHSMEQSMGIFGPASTRYGGAHPESEPETTALVRFCRTERIRHATALHTQGEVIYWQYGNYRPARSEKMAEIMATASGYALDAPVGIAVGGGFKDWFIGEFNRPGFTVEIGKGENPLPIDSAFRLYTELKEMLMLTAIM